MLRRGVRLFCWPERIWIASDFFRPKNEMTLDCFILRLPSFFTNDNHPQSRVISAHSWYLASFFLPRISTDLTGSTVFFYSGGGDYNVMKVTCLSCPNRRRKVMCSACESYSKEVPAFLKRFLAAFWLHYRACCLKMQYRILDKVQTVNAV